MRGRRRLTSEQKDGSATRVKPWISPIVWILGILVVATLCILALSHVSSKSIKISTRCDKVTLPTSITLFLSDIKQIRLWGFQGAIDRIDQIQTMGITKAINSQTQLLIKPISPPDPQSPGPFIQVSPKPVYGPITAVLPANTELSINPIGRLSLIIRSGHDVGPSFSIQSDVVDMSIDRIGTNFDTETRLDNGAFQVENKMVMVDAKCDPIVPTHPQTSAIIDANGDQTSFSKRGQSSLIAIISSSVILSSCKGSVLYVEDDKSNRLRSKTDLLPNS